MEHPALLAFDVNETLLSLAPIKTRLEEVFGMGPPVGEWFARMLHGSLVANHVDEYRSFGEIGVEALLTVASKRKIPLAVDDAQEIVSAMAGLPPHPDVKEAIERLSAAGFTMVTLTNGSTSAANAQVDNAGLRPFISRVISVEEVGRFKPAPEPYLHAADLMGVAVGEMMLVAAHDWDCAGAVHAGAQTAFVKRPGVAWSLPSPPPELVVEDIAGLADVLVASIHSSG
ncbi:MAG: haloacid dehalogenase type II [Actinomycetota bacterium]|nr:haloacid dehalogenase type II [Actinomycetota bacterium]